MYPRHPSIDNPVREDFNVSNCNADRRRRLRPRLGIDRVVAISDTLDVKLVVSPGAARSLAGLPARDRLLLFGRVEAFAAEPFATRPGTRPLRGHKGRVRIRQGDWRAICRIDDAADTVILERVEHRREVYR